MRQLILFITLIFAITICYSQNSDSLKHDSVITGQVQDKMQNRNSYQDSMDRVTMNNNLNSLVQLQKEREKKQRQQAYLRIGLGILFLVVLIIGVTRKRKQKNNVA